MGTARATATYSKPYVPLYDPGMVKRLIVGVQEARNRFRERIDAAEKNGEHTILVRRSKTAAMIVDPTWYRRACEALGDPWEG